MNEYLAIDSGEYLCTSSLHELIAEWLNATIWLILYFSVCL